MLGYYLEYRSIIASLERSLNTGRAPLATIFLPSGFVLRSSNSSVEDLGQDLEGPLRSDCQPGRQIGLVTIDSTAHSSGS